MSIDPSLYQSIDLFFGGLLEDALDAIIIPNLSAFGRTGCRMFLLSDVLYSRDARPEARAKP